MVIFEYFAALDSFLDTLRLDAEFLLSGKKFRGIPQPSDKVDKTAQFFVLDNRSERV